MGIGTSSEKTSEQDPNNYDFRKALENSVELQEGDFVLYLFKDNGDTDHGGSFEIVLYNPNFSAKCFRLLRLEDCDEAREKFRYEKEHLLSLDGLRTAVILVIINKYLKFVCRNWKFMPPSF